MNYNLLLYLKLSENSFYQYTSAIQAYNLKYYSDFYIHANGKQDASPLTDEDEPAIGSANGLYFLISGNTDTEIQGNLLAKNGVMKGTVNCRGMYPGRVIYNNIQIKGGAAGGGYYLITREGFAEENVNGLLTTSTLLNLLPMSNLSAVVKTVTNAYSLLI